MIVFIFPTKSYKGKNKILFWQMSWSWYWQHMELVKNRQQLLNIFKIIFLTIVKDKFSFKVWLHAMEFCFVLFSFSTSFSRCRTSWAHDLYKGPQTLCLAWQPPPLIRLEVKSQSCHQPCWPSGMVGDRAACPPATRLTSQGSWPVSSGAGHKNPGIPITA